MLTFAQFSGLNNVLPLERLPTDALAVAENVDFGLTGEASRRTGYAQRSAECSRTLHPIGENFLAVRFGDLVVIDTDGEWVRTLLFCLGTTRVWFADLPDGRVAFSNGQQAGVTDGETVTGLGIPIPADLGTPIVGSGQLPGGEYRYWLTYVRDADAREGGPAYSAAIIIDQEFTDCGISIVDLPVRAGYSINVYFSGQNDGGAYFAGNTTEATFTFDGPTSLLVRPCRTAGASPAPIGRLLAVWGARLLVADGSVLWASRPFQHELFDLGRDFKQFSSPITLVQPVDDGLWIGTETELAFLAGDAFDTLVYRSITADLAILGSGVSIPGEHISVGEGRGRGPAWVGIVGGELCAGFNGGQFVRLTAGRYRVDSSVAEVVATFRLLGDVPQYVAIPQ